MKKRLALLLAVLMAFSMFIAVSAAESDHIDKLRVGVSSWPKTLDPVGEMGKTNTRWLNQVYDTLLYCQNDGTVSSYICDSWNRIDNTTAEFKLKEGITFHNGDPLTANDVKFSYDRVLHDDTGYVNANIPGVVSTIDTVEVIDDLTLRITTKGPDPIFFDRCAAMLGVYIVPEKYLNEVGNEVFGTNPVGSGPYKVDSISPEKLELSFYEGYYDEKPLAEKIEYLYISEESGLLTAMITGEIDLALDISVTASDILKREKNVQVFSQETSTAHLLRFNTKSGALADKNVRKALSLAIDRQLLVETLWNGYATVPNGYNYTEYGRYYIPDYPEYEYNVEKAKQLIAESSYDGSVISYQVVPGYYAMGVEAAEAIVDMWKQIGVNAQVEYVEAIKSSTIVNVANWSNGIRFSDPLGGLWVLWGEGSGPQKDFWDAPERFNELGKLVTEEMDDAARTAYYKEMMEIWDDDLPGTILYNPNTMYAVRKGLSWDYMTGRAFNFRAGYLKAE